MRNYLILTGFLIGLMISVVLVGREMVVAYEESIHLELEAKLLQLKASEAEMLKKANFGARATSSQEQRSDFKL